MATKITAVLVVAALIWCGAMMEVGALNVRTSEGPVSPVVLQDTLYDVFLLETPLGGYDPDLMQSLGLFHAGIGFRGVNVSSVTGKPQEIIMELRIVTGEMIDAVMPASINPVTGEMKWRNTQEIWWVLRDEAWWHWGNLTQETYLTTLSSKQVEAVKCWSDSWATAITDYLLFNVVLRDDAYASRPFLKSVTCYDFAWATIDTLYDLGASFASSSSSSALHREIINLAVSDAPVRVYDDVRTVAKFYLLLGQSFSSIQHNLTWTNFKDMLLEFNREYDGFFFHGDHDTYWKLSLTSPVIHLPVYKAITPYPAGPRNPTNIPQHCLDIIA